VWQYPYDPGRNPKQMRFHSVIAKEKLFGGSAGGGKRLALDTPIPTPDGWTEMRQLHIGSYVLDELGNAALVTYVSPNVYGDSYAIEFDGRHIIHADAEHLWVTSITGSTLTVTTSEIRRTLDEGHYISSLDQNGLVQRREITDIRKTPDVEMCCIAVNSASRLYLAGSERIPTHNTEAMLAEVLRPILEWGVKCLLLRRTTTAMVEIKERLLMRIPPEVGKWHEQKNTWKFRNGGQLVLGYLEHDNDVQRYAGSEFFMIAWDELTQFTEWQYTRMFHPLRISTSHPSYDAIQAAGIEPYYIAATNPGMSGHMWVKARFIDPAPPGVVWRPTPTPLNPKPGTRIFVPSRLTDNPFLGDDYLANLQSMDENEQRMLIDGDWDVYEGQMFPEFRRDIHVMPAGDFEIPLAMPKVMGIDYGLVAPFAAVWIALFPDNLHVMYRELYQTELLPEEQVALILESERKGERTPSRPIPAYLDSSCWNREPTSPKPESPHQAPRDSIAWRYQRAGLPVRQSDRTPGSRIARVANYKRLLKVQRDGRPRLIILDNCPNFIRTFGQLLRDKNKPEDVDTKGEDHLYDSCGYAIAGAGHLPPHESVIRTQLRQNEARYRDTKVLDPFRT
jgi:hypothetical protein